MSCCRDEGQRVKSSDNLGKPCTCVLCGYSGEEDHLHGLGTQGRSTERNHRGVYSMRLQKLPQLGSRQGD